MKKIFIPLFCYLLFSIQVNSQVITCSSNTNSPGQYNNLHDAIEAANPGDTIYVHGSTNGYGTVIVNKRLTFIADVRVTF